MTKIKFNLTVINFISIPCKLLNSADVAALPGNNSSLCLHLEEKLMPRLSDVSLGQCLPINTDSWLTVFCKAVTDLGTLS